MLYSAATALLLAAGAVNAAPNPNIEARQSGLDAFVAAERIKAVNGVLANIGPNGALATNASRGVVIGMSGSCWTSFRGPKG